MENGSLLEKLEGSESMQPILCSNSKAASWLSLDCLVWLMIEICLTLSPGLRSELMMYPLVTEAVVRLCEPWLLTKHPHSSVSTCKIRNAVSLCHADTNTDWLSANKTSGDIENELISATKSTRFVHFTPEFPQFHSKRCSRLGREDWREALSRFRSCPHAEKRHFVTRG